VRRLKWPEVDAILECLGYYADEPGSYLTSGKVTGPKGFILGPLDADEDVTPQEIAEFLVQIVELLEEDVYPCVWPERYS